MEMDFKNQLVVGTLGAAVLCVAGYGLYQESKRSSARAQVASATDTGSEQPAGESESVPPSFQIETQPAVLGGSTGHRARAVGGPGLRFEWSIKGGALEPGTDQDTAFWSAGEAGEVLLVCRGFSPAGAVSTVVARIPIKVLPTIARFEAQPVVITQGSNAKLSWDAKNFRRLILNPGAQDVAGQTGAGLDVKPTDTTTFLLSATNDFGDTATRDLVLKVVPPPQLVSLRTEPRSGGSEALVVVGEFKGGKAELSDGNGVIASSETSPLSAEVPSAKAGASIRFVVTNEAGDSAIGTLIVPVNKP